METKTPENTQAKNIKTNTVADTPTQLYDRLKRSQACSQARMAAMTRELLRRSILEGSNRAVS